MTIKKTAHFKASRAKVWKILTESEYSKQYMYGCSMISDWKVGSDLIWKGPNAKGEEQVFVTGKVIAFVPHSFLQYSLYPAGADYDDVPENHIIQSYSLSHADDGCEVDILQEGFDIIANGEQRYKDSLGGWDGLIESMQKLAAE